MKTEVVQNREESYVWKIDYVTCVFVTDGLLWEIFLLVHNCWILHLGCFHTWIRVHFFRKSRRRKGRMPYNILITEHHLIFFFWSTSFRRFLFCQQKLMLDLTLGAAAGFMMAASVWSLLIPATEKTSAHYKDFVWVPVSVGFFLGCAFVFVVDKLIPLPTGDLICYWLYLIGLHLRAYRMKNWNKIFNLPPPKIFNEGALKNCSQGKWRRCTFSNYLFNRGSREPVGAVATSPSRFFIPNKMSS